MSKSLGAEIGKKHPFESPQQEAYLSLLRTASVLSAPFSRLFASHGLTEATYNALRILRGGGERGRLCGEIADMLVHRVPDVTRLVDRLEKEGLARRERSGEDRRAVYVRISREGVRRLAELDEPVALLHKRQFAGLSRKELADLIRLLDLARDRP